jgi:hypothetical protein
MSYSLKLIQHPKIKPRNKSGYTILSYEKGTEEESLILYRSVVFFKDELVCFTTPKSILFSKFTEKYLEINENLIVNEMIFGTTIALFYCNGSWEISMRRNIGCHRIIQNEKISYREKFFQILGRTLHSLNGKYCYQFVMKEKLSQLYLVAVYKIVSSGWAEYISPNEYEYWECFCGTEQSPVVSFPKRIEGKNYKYLRDHYGSVHTDSNFMGVSITNTITGERTKLLNPNYFEKQAIDKINHNLFYHFLCFQKIQKVKDFIEFFPQYKNEFSELQKHLNTFIRGIFQSYLDFYVFKKVSFISIRYAYHISYLHYSEYLPKKKKITYDIVEKYVNSLEPNYLLHFLYA